jgi:hypothetical protein
LTLQQIVLQNVASRCGVQRILEIVMSTKYQMTYIDWAGNRQTAQVIVKRNDWSDGAIAYTAHGELGDGRRGHTEFEAMHILAVTHAQGFVTAELN